MVASDSGLPDAEVIRRVVAGEVDLFEELLLRYQEHVGRIVAGHVPREMIEEVAHDVFVRAYTSLPTYSFRTPFSHWLSTIAVRSCYDVWRSVSARKEVPLGGPSDAVEEQQQWTEHLLAAESRDRFDTMVRQRDASNLLQRALAQLSPENRMVVALVHLEGHSVREAAELLGWTVVNVKVRAHRARQQLRKILDTSMKDFT
ncbi:MAG TPA: RNA polymerase sigma factor [Nitrospiraceae bacterium]|nr:RNA polymerase sigma factor [Nitrospiraceae bacterium]